MKIKNLSYLLLISLVLCSCHGKRLSTKHFMPVNSLAELNGRYLNEGSGLSGMFNIYNNNEINLINLDFSVKNSLQVSYVDTAGCKSFTLKGKEKENFLEIYFNNTRFYLFPLLVINNIDRLRIGKGIDGRLLVYNWSENYGMLMPLGAAGSTSDEYSKSFDCYDRDVNHSLFLTQVDGKWGYTGGDGAMVIQPVYDYAQPFKDGRAKVSRNKLWGYIDTVNSEIIPITYNIIMRFQDGLMRVCKDEKWGIVDSLGNEVAAIQYDDIKAFGIWSWRDSLFSDLAEVAKDGKKGFINKKGQVVIPIEYDEIESSTYCNRKGDISYYRTRSGEKYGYISGKGVLCRPVFDKAGIRLSHNGFSPKNRILMDEIGRYTEVIYEGEPHLFTEGGILYKYKKLGFFKENRLVVDFESGFLISK